MCLCVFMHVCACVCVCTCAQARRMFTKRWQKQLTLFFLEDKISEIFRWLYVCLFFSLWFLLSGCTFLNNKTESLCTLERKKKGFSTWGKSFKSFYTFYFIKFTYFNSLSPLNVNWHSCLVGHTCGLWGVWSVLPSVSIRACSSSAKHVGLLFPINSQ